MVSARIVKKNEVMPESHVGFGVAYFFLLQMVLIWYDDKDVTKEDMVKDARTNYRLFTLFND
ncbi:MAG: hypothetical protein RR830_11345 [Enterococcus sp.]|jgi:hypothetical protein